jgi:phospholipid/cholesterol/gamma-HCH transport system permease protein
MRSTSLSRSSPLPLALLGWIGRTALATVAYAGGLGLLTLGAAVSALTPRRGSGRSEPGFIRTMTHEVFWMLALGLPLVGLVHIALGSFLSLQAYYGSTFVDGTGAVVGVGLLRNLGGVMTGLTLAGILASRIIPELRALSHAGAPSGNAPDSLGSPMQGRRVPATAHSDSDTGNDYRAARLAAPRIAAAAVACVLLSQWGVAVGTVVGWRASQSLMGLPGGMFFLMMGKMMWLRDVVSLIIKGLFFGGVPCAICCYEGLRPQEPPQIAWLTDSLNPSRGVAPSLTIPVFRAACLSFAGVMLVNMSWFILVYHAVPFYGPTLLRPASP